MRSIDRFRGCLLAGAAGDALGYRVEFLSEAGIFDRFGKSGITEFSLRNSIAEISDDTQMTLFTATGLLLGKTRGMTRCIMGNYEGYIRESYYDWYRTQTESYPLLGDNHHSWLVNVPQLFSRRAPGNTCMTALRGKERGSTENRINHSKGCGGVMRVAPIGLYFCDDKFYTIEESDRTGAEAAAITHGHDLGWIPAAALVHIIRRLAENEDESILSAVQDAMKTISALYPDSEYLEDFLVLLQKAIDLSQEDCNDLDAIHLLGEGWVAEETLAIAVYCALKYPNDIEKALIASVNHGGDSDSTGAVTGNILGAALGMAAIPEKFLEHLELKDIILEIADDLYNDCKMTAYSDYRDPIWISKYIEMNYSPAGIPPLDGVGYVIVNSALESLEELNDHLENLSAALANWNSNCFTAIEIIDYPAASDIGNRITDLVQLESSIKDALEWMEELSGRSWDYTRETWENFGGYHPPYKISVYDNMLRFIIETLRKLKATVYESKDGGHKHEDLWREKGYVLGTVTHYIQFQGPDQYWAALYICWSD